MVRTLQVADLLVAAIAAHFLGWTPAPTVARDYAPKIDDAQFKAWIDSLQSLGVFVVPISKESTLNTRGSDTVRHTFGIILAEKGTTGDLPTNEWMDARVRVLDELDDHFGDLRNPLVDDEQKKLYAVESRIPLLFDPDAYRFNHAYFGLWILTLEEKVRVS